MNAEQVWEEFRSELSSGGLSARHSGQVGPYTPASVLGSPQLERMRARIVGCSKPIIEHGEEKLIFRLETGPNDEIRLDFVVSGDEWKFVMFDGFTIPMRKLPELPCRNFPGYPGHEKRMRMELVVSKMLHFYRRLREERSKEEAQSWFLDGEGYKVNVVSWGPYFTLRKAFVIHSAWVENRYWNQCTSIEELSDKRSVLKVLEDEYFALYEVTGHLRTYVGFGEYRELYEVIWRDRAKACGWSAAFSYAGGDTTMEFT